MTISTGGLIAGALALAIALTPSPATAAIKVGERAPDFEMTLIDGSQDPQRGSPRNRSSSRISGRRGAGRARAELPLPRYLLPDAQGQGPASLRGRNRGFAPRVATEPLFAALAIPSARRIKGAFGVMGALPTNYIIDRAGVVRYAKPGALELADMNRLLVPLLSEPAPTP